MSKTGAPITWATIKTYFTAMDIDHMQNEGIDLSQYSQVVQFGQQIYKAVSTGRMPPKSSGEQPWSPAWVQNFQAWMKAGYPQ
ncbi:MAG TPA: hypothetical protein VGZ00_01380 [Candidatus Baltobacteraceae bacterium]|jgi:hypothetical protein|nr:hypothetical protein [Candidatus Baltobacteraceae bacterium]